MWEYKIIEDCRSIHECGSPEAERDLNELGKEGWELICITTRIDSCSDVHQFWYLKRRI